MTVTRDDIKGLHEKVDANHREVYENVTKPLNDVAVQIGRLVTSMDHNSKIMDGLNASQIKMGERLRDTTLNHSNRLTKLEANQKNSKNFWDKFGVPLTLAVFVGLSTINYWAK